MTLTNEPPSDDPRLARAQERSKTLQGKIVAAMEELEREFTGVDQTREPGRFAIEPWASTHRRERRARRRRPDGDAARAPVRKNGRALLDRLWRLPKEFAAQIPGAAKRPALLGRGRFGHRPSLEPTCADCAHGHAICRRCRGVVGRSAPCTVAPGTSSPRPDFDPSALVPACSPAIADHPN